MKKQTNKLWLSKTTVANLSEALQHTVKGGTINITNDCVLVPITNGNNCETRYQWLCRSKQAADCATTLNFCQQLTCQFNCPVPTL